MPVGWAGGRCDGTTGIEGQLSHEHRFIHHLAAGKGAEAFFQSGIVKLTRDTADWDHEQTKPRLPWIPLSARDYCSHRVALSSLLSELPGYRAAVSRAGGDREL